VRTDSIHIAWCGQRTVAASSSDAQRKAHEDGSFDSRLLSKLPQNRILGGLPVVDAAAGHLRSGVDIDVVEDQQPAVGIRHVGHGSLIAVRMPAGHRRQLLCTAGSRTAVSVHALILPYTRTDPASWPSLTDQSRIRWRFGSCDRSG
jgi:hypothetical protein